MVIQYGDGLDGKQIVFTPMDDGKATFHSYELLHQFLWAGNATITIVSKLTHHRYTFKIAQAFKEHLYFVSFLNGPDNESNYQYLGMVDITNQDFYLTKNSKVTDKAPCFIAFRWFVGMLWHNPENLFAKAEIWHEGKCGRCGRKLTVPSSIEAGIGPDCMAKMGGD